MTFIQTLGAVVVGGLITLCGQLSLEIWRELRLRKLNAEKSRDEMRVAARLVILDLVAMLPLLEAAGETSRWWTQLELPVGAWDSHPSLNLRRLGLGSMQKELHHGAATAIEVLLPIAMPSVSPDDPLHQLAQAGQSS
jgi:hypothetical protein